jgi:tetratricopeptide (TPR) repeat protein
MESEMDLQLEIAYAMRDEGDCFYSQGQYFKAFNCYDRAQHSFLGTPFGYGLWQKKGRCALHVGRYDAAMSCFGWYVGSYTFDESSSFFIMASELCRIGKFEDAVVYFDEAVELQVMENGEKWDHTLFVDTRQLLLTMLANENIEGEYKESEAEKGEREGRDLMQQEKYEDAIACYDRLIPLIEQCHTGEIRQRKMTCAMLRKGNCYWASGKYLDAYNCYDRAQHLFPERSSEKTRWKKKLWLKKGRCLLKTGKYVKAEDCFRIGGFRTDIFNKCYPPFIMANELYRQEKYSDALVYFDRSLEADLKEGGANQDIILFGKAKCLMSNNQIDEATACFERVNNLEMLYEDDKRREMLNRFFNIAGMEIEMEIEIIAIKKYTV